MKIIICPFCRNEVKIKKIKKKFVTCKICKKKMKIGFLSQIRGIFDLVKVKSMMRKELEKT